MVVEKPKILPWERVVALWGKKDLFSEEEQRILVLSRCFWDIEYFAQYVTTRWTSDKETGKQFMTPDLHKSLWELLRAKIDFDCIVSRNMGKTTSVSKIWCLWALLFQEEKYILLIMGKGLGEEVIGDIRYELEANEVIRWLFGELVPNANKADKVNERWRQRELHLILGLPNPFS